MIESNCLFHFIVSGTIDNNIDFLKEKLNFDKNCKLIDYIIGVISKNLPYLKKIIGNHKSEYAFIDTEDVTRVDKYLRLNKNKYRILKKWHYFFNEYSMSAILRDIIKFFYDGIVKYGVGEFIRMISKKLNISKINIDLKSRLTHMMSTYIKKSILFSLVIENIQFYT